MKKRKAKTVFERAGYTRKDHAVTTLILAVIVTVSNDAGTKLKCDHALKSLRKLNRLVNS